MKWPWVTRKEMEEALRQQRFIAAGAMQRIEALETQPVLDPGEFKTRTVTSAGHIEDHNQIAAWINDHQEFHVPKDLSR